MGMKAQLYYSNTQKQNGESFSNFTKLFLWSLLTTCTVIYFIRSCRYSNLNVKLIQVWIEHTVKRSFLKTCKHVCTELMKTVISNEPFTCAGRTRVTDLCNSGVGNTSTCRFKFTESLTEVYTNSNGASQEMCTCRPAYICIHLQTFCMSAYTKNLVTPITLKVHSD